MTSLNTNQAERTKRLFLSSLYKKEPELDELVKTVSNMISYEASQGHPGISFGKEDISGFEYVNNASMMHIATYFKASGYDVHIQGAIHSDDDIQIDYIFICWVDILSMFNKETFKTK